MGSSAFVQPQLDPAVAGQHSPRQRDRQGAQPALLRRCFVADKDGLRLQVCEHIVDAAGSGYTDTSSWYWAALTGQSQGPWQAVTRARPI